MSCPGHPAFVFYKVIKKIKKRLENEARRRIIEIHQKICVTDKEKGP